MADNARAWSLIAIDDDRQYGGNRGYNDIPEQVYRYDSDVANHKQVSVGDLVFVRDRDRLRGIARVESVHAAPATKVRLRCPECRSAGIKERKKASPRWRCRNGHEFNNALEEIAEVTGFEAHFPTTFVATPDAITSTRLKAAALRPSDQASIEEIDPAKLEGELLGGFPETRDVLAAFNQSRVPGSNDAESEPDLEPDAGTAFNPSVSDLRERVLRGIKLRRGQRRFREELIRRYGGACMVSGCTLLDIVEAAHVWPYRGEEDNHAKNGLLLRADLHTLFDLNLLAVDPVNLVVRIHPVARAAGYEALEGVPLRFMPGLEPAMEPFRLRWVAFLSRTR